MTDQKQTRCGVVAVDAAAPDQVDGRVPCDDHAVNMLFTRDSSGDLTGIVVNLACPAQCHESLTSTRRPRNSQTAHENLFWSPRGVPARKWFTKIATKNGISPKLEYIFSLLKST